MDRLPALSVHRPWTTLLLHHFKDPENRVWATNYRGDVLIAGAITWDPRAIPFARDIARVPGPHTRGLTTPIDVDPAQHPTGIIGVVELYDVCTDARDNPGARCGCPRWALAGQCHWRIRNPRPFDEPIPHRGHHRLWKVDDEAWPLVELQLKAVGR